MKVMRVCGIWAVSAIVLIAIGCGGGSTSNFMPSNVSLFPPATVPLVKLSTDTFTNSTSQHATEVEPDSFAFGSTIITSFQVARIAGGGSADIGFAISNDSGATWQSGLIPGLTTFQGGGANSAVSDPSVVYDSKHAVWIISSLPISVGKIQAVVSRSTDGGATWGGPIVVGQGAGLDKDWITCDNTASSPFFGNCYMEWDDNGNGNLIEMSTSSDGGLTWSPAATPAGPAHGVAAEQLVQPNGTVVAPFWSDGLGEIESFLSSDGGATWNAPVVVASINARPTAGGLRADPLPSVATDSAGNIYVVWEDCRFRTNCSSNDLVMSTSADGVTWSAPARIPIDALTSGVDHFIPGLGIDPTTGGSTAHLGLTYYYYPQANCSASSCALYVGFISSSDGGATWSAPAPIAGPMSLSWLVSTSQGRMVGDYIATSFIGGKAFGVFAVAKVNSGTTFDEAIYTTQAGFNVAAAQGRFSSAGERPVAAAKPQPSFTPRKVQ